MSWLSVFVGGPFLYWTLWTSEGSTKVVDGNNNNDFCRNNQRVSCHLYFHTWVFPHLSTSYPSRYIPIPTLGTWVIGRSTQWLSPCRWRCLSFKLHSFLELLPSSSCIGWMADVGDYIFLRGLKSSLSLGTFFQCPAHSNGRHLQDGDKNTVRDWSSAQ